jgi:ferritin
MTKQQLIEKLNGDLKNEYTHMHFYLQSSFIIEGLHRAEIGEWLAKCLVKNEVFNMKIEDEQDFYIYFVYGNRSGLYEDE